jgi:hypothetical protein
MYEQAIKTARRNSHRPETIIAKAIALLPDVPTGLLEAAGVAEDERGIRRAAREVAVRLLALQLHMSPAYLDRELRPSRSPKPSLAQTFLS